jgi:hypothetical protein
LDLRESLEVEASEAVSQGLDSAMVEGTALVLRGERAEEMESGALSLVVWLVVEVEGREEAAVSALEGVAMDCEEGRARSAIE